jgi:hypothetical protein
MSTQIEHRTFVLSLPPEPTSFSFVYSFALHRQLEAVSSRLSARIMGSYDAFVQVSLSFYYFLLFQDLALLRNVSRFCLLSQGMVEVGQLNQDIERTAKLCDIGRSHLLTARQSLTHAGMMEE